MGDGTVRRWTVLAPVADFGGVESAGRGEEAVDWDGPEDGRREACTLGFAALETVEALNRVPGEAAVAAPWGGVLPDGCFVLVLSSASLVLHRAAVETVFPDAGPPERPQSFAVHTLRREAGTGYFVLGADRAGALHGAYGLLDALGFRWFSPDPWDAVAPDALPRSLPALDFEAAPSFESRGFMGGHRADAAFLLWMARNRMNAWGDEKDLSALRRKLCILTTGGGHDTFGRYLPAKEYFGAHPEWYGLRGGKRSPKVHEGMGDNICLSNPGARAAVAANAVADLAEGDRRTLDVLMLWPYDHYDSWCECAECAALGNKMDHMLLLVHDVRQAVRRAMAEGRLKRSVLVSVCAYHNTLPPPTRPLPPDFDHENVVVQMFVIERCYAHAFDDPRCAEANAKLLEIWRGWTSPSCPFRGRLKIGEYYNVSTFAGMSVPFMGVMERDIPFYRRTGARDIDYMHPLVRHWGTHALTNCQFAATIWNHELDARAWLADFLRRRYGPLAGRMETFYRRLEAAMRNCKPLKHYMGVVTDAPPEKLWPLPDYRLASLNRTLPADGSPEKPAVLFESEHLGYAPSERTRNDGPSVIETMDLLHEAAAILDAAVLECGDPAVAARLAADVRRFRYTHLLVRFIHRFVRLRMLENAGDAALARAEAYALREVGETLRAERLMCLNFKDAMLETGLGATFHPKTYERVMERYFPGEGRPSADAADAHPA